MSTKQPVGRATRAILFAISVSAVVLAAGHSRAAAIPAAAACPAGVPAQTGTTGDEKLKTGREAGCLLGDSGADLLAGGRGDDVLDPGPGIDRTRGGGGDDTIVVRAGCELGEGERIKGGGGTDTLQSPFTLAELTAMGVRVKSIETFEVVPPENSGGCAMTATGLVCTCCDLEGFSPDAACTGCEAGRMLNDPRRGDGDMEESKIPDPTCDEVPTCAEMSCGTHGTCIVNASGGPACDCDDGWAGNNCEACQPLYELRDGRCVLGRECGIAMCSGHGRCEADVDGNIACDCDEGFDTDASCGRPDVVIGGPKHVPGDGGPVDFTVDTNNGAHCTADYEWTVEGPGTIQPHPTDSRRATYTPPTSVAGHLDVASIHAECENSPPHRAEFETTITSGADDSPGGINGNCATELEPIEDAVLEWLDQQGINGATLAVTYFEKVVCLRGFGSRRVDVATANVAPMKQCTPMRVASVTKPFARAAIRGNLWGMTIPPALGGGTLDENTPVLPLVAQDIGLGPNGEIPWQAPAALYANNHPVNHPNILLPCNLTNGLIHPNWGNITINSLLAHTAGLPPNQNYAFSPGVRSCTGVMGEVCGSFSNMGDPTISANTRIANDLGLAYGVPQTSDVVRWIAGQCPFDLVGANRFRYSNVGFTVAGRIAENLSPAAGDTWDEFVTGFLEDDEIIGLDLPGTPIVYLGQNLGDGPADFELPDYMKEADYYTWRADSTDVTIATGSQGMWAFNETVAAPYGAADFNLMDSHGGLVMNALALAKFGSTYNVQTGSPRSLLRGGPGLQTYDPTNGLITHGGLLFGTSALIWELPTTDPANTTNPNGAGCLIPADVQDTADPNTPPTNGLNALAVTPCPVPQGIRISVIFNGEQRAGNDPAFIRGRHDWGLLSHMLRLAASQVGTTAEEWHDVAPLSDLGLRIDCDQECGFGSCWPWTCADGVLNPENGEECDDGNHDYDDGCRPDCTLPPDEPNGFVQCEGEEPGGCLGGPCAPRNEDYPVSLSELVDPYSERHPDGDYSPHTFCHDSHTSLGSPWEEATCVEGEYLGEKIGVCMECGVDTMQGCACPAPNAEDGGCNVNFDGYECIGGRCWQGGDVPEWMCTADCAEDIYGNQGYCIHDDEYGAVCNDISCSEPDFGYCGSEFDGRICNINYDGGCDNGECCIFECEDDVNCHDMGYSDGHQCVGGRCKLP
jgi:CubicO group peptidase (beta-lactamase class C family)